MLDPLINEFFGAASDPVELALRFMLVVLVFDCIFGTISNLISANRK